MLEAQTYGNDCCFLTLTYRNPPVGPPRGNLSPDDLVNFLKRLRWHFPDRRIRYYAVGEYGDTTWRPHYHLALYGLGPEYGEVISGIWGYGFAYAVPLCEKTAAYVCGYVLKKLTKPRDPRLAGRHPEFARMSRMPGLGIGCVESITKTGHTAYGATSIAVNGDVPAVLRQGQKLWPLGRYLRGKLRLEHGADGPGLPAAPRERWLEELRLLREASGSGTRYRLFRPFLEEQKALSIEAREKLKRKRTL